MASMPERRDREMACFRAAQERCGAEKPY